MCHPHDSSQLCFLGLKPCFEGFHSSFAADGYIELIVLGCSGHNISRALGPLLAFKLFYFQHVSLLAF